ncbi:UvrD-helicase domain-containing protein [Kitasatospora purpeofusca]|uniref:UvrD-helicase domain-containing protein n=1 Tax=Kitasatospora purpeofusca TaxID=67352 RepID=UPI002250A23B|nr:ATP-dependent helicase [Kitasatospora purpeofusca]MCX4752430.1 ATP-dependent helicase [Kitasatospora purpeofusca]WSR32003.1 ATP-dependent helicase [Kitasatospora purpeofusca]
MTETDPPADPRQKLRELGPADLLVVAPAGCGKTYALADRAAGLIRAGHIASPRKILALTFSNKARDNLNARLRQVMSARESASVAVSNFHGLAGRILRAHGKVLDLDPQQAFPERVQINRHREAAGINYKNSQAADLALSQAKVGLWDDDEVLRRLAAAGNAEALRYELALRGAGHIDYNDLIRQGARLLADPRVAQLYHEHFAVVLVDEVQDLSLLQFGMVQAIGTGRTTYAGDPAQGIYAFAGAEPDLVFEAIHAVVQDTVELNVSYRSSPAVLAAVNVLADELGTTRLRCANPEKWGDDASVEMVISDDPDDEARALVPEIRQQLEAQPDLTIGVVARRTTRLNELITALDADGIAFQNWQLDTHQPEIVGLLQRHVREATARQIAPEAQLQRLAELCQADLPVDAAEASDHLSGAIASLREQLDADMTVAQAVATCSAAQASEAPVTPGLHLLSGHAGKGQEFDVVYIVGLEEGQIPDFRSTTDALLAEELRVLHVMASRAKKRLVCTRVENRWCTETWYKAEGPSRWWHLLANVATN